MHFSKKNKTVSLVPPVGGYPVTQGLTIKQSWKKI